MGRAADSNLVYCVIVHADPLIVLGPFDKEAAGNFASNHRERNPHVLVFADVLHAPPADEPITDGLDTDTEGDE